MKPRHLVLAAALAGAAALAAFGDNSPGGDVVEPVVRTAPPARASRAAARHDEPAQVLRLVPRDTLLGEGEFKEGGEDVFGRQDWNPPPPPPARLPPPPPPSAPPLPFTYLGKAVADGAWQVYLTRGDRAYVVREKDVVDGVYRVDAIAPPLVTFTYLPLNQVQQLNIGVFD